MTCPKCKSPLENLGNVSGIILTGNPPQWDEMHVCHECKFKKVERVQSKPSPSYDYLDSYTTEL